MNKCRRIYMALIWYSRVIHREYDAAVRVSHCHPYLPGNLICAPNIGNAFDSVEADSGRSTAGGHLPRE